VPFSPCPIREDLIGFPQAVGFCRTKVTKTASHFRSSRNRHVGVAVVGRQKDRVVMSTHCVIAIVLFGKAVVFFGNRNWGEPINTQRSLAERIITSKTWFFCL
jgi:hypothetical protein